MARTIDINKSDNEYFVTRQQLEKLKSAGQLETGAVYHITNENYSEVSGTVEDGKWTSLTIDGEEHPIKGIDEEDIPAQFIKDAAVSGNSLVLTKQDDTTVRFSPQSGGGSGGPAMIEATYAELKDLKENGQLVPGTSYRMTDYVTMTKYDEFAYAALFSEEANPMDEEGNQLPAFDENDSPVWQFSMQHPFDLILFADTPYTFNAQAHAALHEGDEYFSERGCHLENWQIWYTFDEYSQDFWGDCKGVIYRMIDESGNDVPYDFKNLVFLGEWITSSPDYVDWMYEPVCEGGPSILEGLKIKNWAYYYTFSNIDDGADFLGPDSTIWDYSGPWGGNKYNKIEATGGTTIEGINCFNLFLGDNRYNNIDVWGDANVLRNAEYCSIGSNAYSTFLINCWSNRIGKDCSDIYLICANDSVIERSSEIHMLADSPNDCLTIVDSYGIMLQPYTANLIGCSFNGCGLLKLVSDKSRGMHELRSIQFDHIWGNSEENLLTIVVEKLDDFCDTDSLGAEMGSLVLKGTQTEVMIENGSEGLLTDNYKWQLENGPSYPEE